MLAKPKMDRPDLRAKAEPVALFRDRQGEPYAYRADVVLPFYSHTRRDEVEKTADNSLGIDRRSFSNLFPCPISLPAAFAQVNGAFATTFSYLFWSV